MHRGGGTPGQVPLVIKLRSHAGLHILAPPLLFPPPESVMAAGAGWKGRLPALLEGFTGPGTPMALSLFFFLLSLLNSLPRRNTISGSSSGECFVHGGCSTGGGRKPLALRLFRAATNKKRVGEVRRGISNENLPGKMTPLMAVSMLMTDGAGVD